MKQQAFERDRGDAWEAFRVQLDGISQGYRLSDGVSAVEFVANYREACHDLALAKSRGYSHMLVARLNELVIQGHNAVYVRRSGYLRSVINFVRADFPRLVRDARSYLLVSTLLFFGTGIGVVWAVLLAPELVYSILSAEQVASLESMYDPGASRLGRERQSDTDFYMFGFYILNNISISFQLFATGLLAGIGTVFYLVFNGVSIGAVMGHLVGIGYSPTFLPFIAGHGSFELMAIVISGAGGLMLGHALIAPGTSTRLDAVRTMSRRAIGLVLGAVLMLVVAAFVEAFWSSSTIVPATVKYGVGIVFWILVLAYLIFGGRRAA
ncbi:MAG: stage II sporulation protein M [Gammaproteobacteria bacterium]|nr:stage II sporulation protein M [Gammaproteobacteria bacterium]